MELTTPQRRMNSMIKWSSVFLPISLLLLLTSIWSGPFSPTYLLWSAIFGMIYSVLALTCWKLSPRPVLYWVLFVPTIILMTQGRYWAQEWVFPEIHHFNWGLSLQYFGAVFTIFFLAVFVLRFFIRKNVSGRVLGMDEDF